MKISILEKKRTVITGASRGIGRAIALALAADKSKLILCGRSLPALEETAALCLGNSANAHGHTLDSAGIKIVNGDLTEENVRQEIINTAATAFGGLDFLINNAGTAIAQPFTETTMRDWEKIMEINAKAPFFLTQLAIPYLKKSEHPVIINISSVVGRIGYANQTAYAASKHALAGFTKSLAREIQADGIRVHLIAPGGVATDMIKETRPDINQEELIRPEQIADIVLFLLSTQSGVIDEVNIHRVTSTPWQ